MKRPAVLIVVIVAVCLVAGCGGSGGEKQAIEDIKTADSLVSDSELDSLSKQMEDLYQIFVLGDIITEEDYNSRIVDVKKQVDDVEKKLAKAKAEYEKVLQMEGVEDYSALSKAIIEWIDARVEWLDTSLKLIEKMSVRHFSTDEVPDPMLVDEIETLEDERAEIEAKSKKLEQQVETLSKKLELKVEFI